MHAEHVETQTQLASLLGVRFEAATSLAHDHFEALRKEGLHISRQIKSSHEAQTSQIQAAESNISQALSSFHASVGQDNSNMARQMMSNHDQQLSQVQSVEHSLTKILANINDRVEQLMHEVHARKVSSVPLDMQVQMYAQFALMEQQITIMTPHTALLNRRNEAPHLRSAKRYSLISPIYGLILTDRLLG
jgi:DNA anti-recombination protein RmuC